MYRSEHQAFIFFSRNYPPAIALVFMNLYHWGTLDWNGHKAGDWFFKSIKDTSKELEISMKTTQRAYELISSGHCNLFESKVEKKKNFNVTWIRVVTKNEELSTINHSQNGYSECSTIVKKTIVQESKRLRYHSQKVQGINILTHNNCMYTEPTLSSEISLTENPARQTDDHLKMIEIWNELIQPSKLESISQSLEKRCGEILAAHFDSDIGQWGKYCSMIASSSFLMGEKFTLTLGWALKAEWIQKVLNGDYDDHEWRKENDMAKKKEPVRLASITLEDVLADCKNEVDRKIKPTLYQQLGAETYASWIHRTGAAFYLEGKQLCVNSCSVFVQSQIKQRFWDKIEKIYNNSYAEMKKEENAYVS